MSIEYVDQKRDMYHIFKKIYSIYNIIKHEENESVIFFALHSLKFLINVLYTDQSFSITDHQLTAQSIWKLYEPNEYQQIKIKYVSELNEIINNSQYNIFRITINNNEIINNFVVIKYNNNLYIPQLPQNITVTIQDITDYILLVNIKFKFEYNIIPGYYEQLPLNKFKIILSEYIDNNRLL